jgi:hypothetical protein
MTEKTVTYQEMDVDEVKEPKGRHMIEFKVAFWTDKVNGEDLPRQCWSSGKVTRSANHRHGISHGERSINTIAEIGPAIEGLAAEAEITIHPSVRAKAYVQSRERAALEEALLAAAVEA